MSKKIKTLKKNKWLSLKKMIWPEKDIYGYIYSHEERCQGSIISILPYRFDENGNIEYLIRAEVTPPWNPSVQIYSSITGGFEGDWRKTAAMELEEEGGYRVLPGEFDYLGYCYGTKSSDTVYYLYTINLTNISSVEANGDGSELEAKAYCFWTKDLDAVMDPLVFMMMHRLYMKLKLGKNIVEGNI